ncbi:MAG: glycosyltransferase family 2 protein [Anaerolineae bacterium]|nr:glycosyltransferase family 2 protein [Anaerolineae bacterium]
MPPAPAAPAPPDLSIIVVNWNTRDLLAGCLESVIGAQLSATGDQPSAGDNRSPFTVHRSLTTEVIVIDNASTDGSAAMVRERFPWARLMQNGENVGFARANNQGIAAASGRYVALLNPDTVVHPGALEALVAFMDEHPAAAACGPRLLNADGTLQHACHPMLTPGRELWRLLFLERLWPCATYPMERWDTTTPRPVEVIKGACLVLRRAALDQVGLLDERYFVYTEEVDLCYRLARAGWSLWYVPAAVVTHFGGGSSRQAEEAMYLQLYRSKVQFYRKFGGEARAREAKAFLALAYAPRWLVAAPVGLFSAAMRRQAQVFQRLLMALPEF